MCLHENYWISKDSNMGEDGCETYSCHCRECGTILSFRVDPKYAIVCAKDSWESFKKADKLNHVLRKEDEENEEIME